MFYTQFENKTAKHWIDGASIYYTMAGTVELFNDGYHLMLNNAQDSLVIYDITGCHAQLALNNKYIRIMQEKEKEISVGQMKIIPFSESTKQ